MHVATPYSRKDPLSECSRPCDNLSCLFFTALWLRQKSVLIDTGAANQRYRLDLLQDVTDQGHHMLTSGTHVPWSGLWIRSQVLIIPDLRSFLKFPTTINNEALFQLPHAPVGGRILSNHLRYSMVLHVGIRVAISLMEVCDVLLGTPGVSLDLFSLSR